MSYVPRHARVPGYKKTLRAASASVAVTAAFISTQPALAASIDGDESAATATVADAAAPETTDTAQPGTAQPDSAANTGTAEQPDTDTADTAPATTDTAGNDLLASVIQDFNPGKFFADIIRAFGATPDSGKQEDPAAHTVKAGSSLTLDAAESVGSEVLNTYPNAHVVVDNTAELAERGITVTTPGALALGVAVSGSAPAGSVDIDFHIEGTDLDTAPAGHITIEVTDAAAEETPDTPSDPVGTSTAGQLNLAYKPAPVNQLATATLAPTVTKTAETTAAHVPEGTRFSLVATRDGKPLATADGATTYPWMTIDQATGVVTASPAHNTQAGTYTAQVTATYPDGSSDVAPVAVAVKAVKDSDKYTPFYTQGHLNPAATQDSEMNLQVKEDYALPEGTTFTLEKDEPGVSIDDTGHITLHANPAAKAGRHLVKVRVAYPDGSQDVVNAVYLVSNKTLIADTITLTGKATTEADALRMKRRTQATLPALAAVAGQTIPQGTKFVGNPRNPDWAKVNESTGEMTLTPSLNDHPGTYTLETMVTFPDGSQHRVNRYVVVESGYSTGEWFKYKRKDGLGKKVGRAIDKALGTELNHGEQAPATQTEEVSLIGTAVKPSQPVAGSGTASAMAPTQAAASATAGTATTQLATTGTDTDMYAAAGLAASGFAFAAAGAFALRRRRQA